MVAFLPRVRSGDAVHRSHGEVDSDQRSGRVRLRTLTLETTMPAVADRHDAPTAIQSNLAAIFISLELSRSDLARSLSA